MSGVETFISFPKPGGGTWMMSENQILDELLTPNADEATREKMRRMIQVMDARAIATLMLISREAKKMSSTPQEPTSQEEIVPEEELIDH
jgi:hypothetical protein